MILAALLIFGATFIYAGFLMSGESTAAGIVSALIGAALLAKPALGVYYLIRGVPDRGDRNPKGGGRRGKSRLKIVKPEKDKPPTIH
jgi:hypothetical protein